MPRVRTRLGSGDNGGVSSRAGTPEPRCPIRVGEPCTLCHINATGPQDCPLVYLVMDDEELREELARTRASARKRA